MPRLSTGFRADNEKSLIFVIPCRKIAQKCRNFAPREQEDYCLILKFCTYERIEMSEMWECIQGG